MLTKYWLQIFYDIIVYSINTISKIAVITDIVNTGILQHPCCVCVFMFLYLVGT